MSVSHVEYHSQNEQDWYAATIAVDVLAFLYVVIFYQVPVETSLFSSAVNFQDNLQKGRRA